jgi:biopolymer transport protein ExbB
MLKYAPIIFTAVFLSILLAVPAVSFSQDDAPDFISIDPVSDTDIAPVPEGPDAEATPPATQNAETSPSTDVTNLLDLIKKGGIVGYGIILLSVISLALIIDYGFTIRKGNILPPGEIRMLEELVKDPSDEAIERFEKRGKSFLSRMTLAGLKESPHGYPAMIKAMEDMGEALASRIARKTEHLNVIGNISPMMGLLGTVIGMLRCFNEIAHMTGAIEPKQLAGGIFEALITTCMGLIVAIPALYCYSVFRNRVDEFSGEAAAKAEQLVSGFKTAGGAS